MKIHKDKKKRNLNLKFENKCAILKSIARNTIISKTVRWNSELKLTTLSSNVFKTRLVKRCFLTGRKQKINKRFNVSRLAFLKLARNGIIPGLKKSTH
jgi:small subunit ribosomal protein S14